jgi:hypothetical protein
MLKGLLTGLTAVERMDLKQLMDWRNKPEFRKYFREYRELNMAMQEQWFEKKVLNDPATIMFSIRRLSDNVLLGCCGFVYVNWVHRQADLSIYIGWNDSYIDDEGYAEDATKILLKYGYDELGLNKTWTEIYDIDEKKKAFYKKLGFHCDGVLRQNYFYDGKWQDSLILSLLASEYNKQK